MIKNVKIRMRGGDVLSAVLYKPKQIRQVIILSHGFGANNEGPSKLFELLARTLYRKNFCVIRYNFRDAGAMGTFDIANLFEDLEAVMKYARRFSKRMILLGHSLGGLVSMEVASRVRRVDAVVLWSPPLALRMPKRMKQFRERYNISFGKALYLMVRSLFAHQKFRAETYFRKVKIPILLLYGDADQFSEYADIGVLRKFPDVHVVKIIGLDHYYHAFRKEMVQRTVAWIEGQNTGDV